MHDIPKFFIISSGRAGSTLMASMLTRAGANFGFGEIESWNERAGAYELKEASKAAEHHNLEVEFKRNSHASVFRMWRRKYHRQQTKRYTRRLLEQADYVKFSYSTLTRIAKKLGYSPRVILLYRPFEDYMLSSFLRSGRQYPEMLDHYIRTYSTGLIALKIYGGCIVHYNEIIDEKDDGWIGRIANITGLNYSNLVQARNAQVRQSSSSKEENLQLSNSALNELQSAVTTLSGKVIEPHRLSERSV